MKILVTGATGLVGAELCARLATEGHQVVRVARKRPKSGLAPGEIVIADFASLLRPQGWLVHLQGVDAVVNCAGVLQDGARERTNDVHVTGASALFEACEMAGIRKVIHFSAIGVDREQPSNFSATKLAGDEALMTRDLDWVILRPSVILGRAAFGASALFRGLASLPFLPVMPDTGRLQVVQLDDVVGTVLFFLRPGSPTRIAVELAGPEQLSMSAVVASYRKWLGHRPARELALPRWAALLLYRLGDFAGSLGWRPPMRTNAAREITRGATGDPRQWSSLTGISPRSLTQALASQPPAVQERWFSGLYFVKPAIFVVLPFFWIMTGIISLTTGWRNGVELLLNSDVAALAEPLVVMGAMADIVVGMMIAWRRTSWLGIWGAITVSMFYAFAGTLLRPDLWNEPLGPLMKILPILVLHFVALAVLEER